MTTQVNKKVSVVCAMTLLVSTLLSPLATSANNSSNPVYISPVSKTQMAGDEYVNVELSYADIYESQLKVELEIQTNFKDELITETEVLEEPSTEILEDSKQSINEIAVNEGQIEATTSQQGLENELNIQSDVENLLESSEPIAELKSTDYKIAGFLNTNFSFQSILKKLSNAFSFLTNNTENQEQQSAFILEIPIHSSFTLNKDNFEIVGKDGETVTPSQTELNENSVKLIFDEFNQVPEELKVSLILDRSETVISGQVIVNEQSTIQYQVNDGQVHVLKIPEINVNLYEVSKFLGLPTLQITDSNLRNECASKTDDYAIEIDENRKLCIDKTVAGPNVNGEYTITLDTTGYIKQQEVVMDTDIVLVVDTSKSMEQEISNLRTYIHDFITTMLGNNTTESPNAIQIAVVNYNSSATNYFKANNISTTGFISQYTDTVKKLINQLGTNTGTNTQDGINEAVNVLNSGRDNANKYVVLFTDGVPSRNDRSESHFRNDNNNFTAAQVEYYTYFKGPLNNGTSTVTLGNITYDGKDTPGGSVSENTYTYNYATLTPLNVTFYSIGYFEGMSIPTGQANNSNYDNITKFLHSIQNVETDLTSYQSKYFTNDINKLGEFYKDIAQKIQSDITNLLTTVTITDVVPDYLDIIGDIKVEGATATSSIINTNEEIGETTLIWEFDSLSENGVKISFNVKPNDPYLGGTNIKTNVKATIEADEIKDINISEIEYGVPQVSRPLIEGGIKVDKQVIKSDGTPFNTDEKFSINVKRIKNNQIQEQLGFNVAGNNIDETVSFYLKGEETNISFNQNTSKNYLTAGMYSVDEIVPGNYERDSIDVEYCDKNFQNCTRVKEGDAPFTSTDTFELDINHRYIKITIINKLVNENYWYDKENIMNHFTYN